MSVEVLGISGSPIPNSNTDHAVQAMLEATGLETAFVKLSTLRIEPCRGCLACKDTNICAVQDGGPALAEQFQTAKAVVLGAYTPYCSLDARTKAFMERMYCLRHRKDLRRAKIAASVITTICPPEATHMPPAVKTAADQLNLWMKSEGMNNLGSMVIVGNPPCIRCGYGDECKWSAIKGRLGPEGTVSSYGVNRFEKNEHLQQNARELGQRIRTAILAAE